MYDSVVLNGSEITERDHSLDISGTNDSDSSLPATTVNNVFVEKCDSSSQTECDIQHNEESLVIEKQLSRVSLINNSNSINKLNETESITSLTNKTPSTTSIQSHSSNDSNKLSSLAVSPNNLNIHDNINNDNDDDELAILNNPQVQNEEELIIFKEKFNDITNENLKLKQDIISLKQNYEHLRNKSFLNLMFYLAPLIVLIGYLIISYL